MAALYCSDHRTTEEMAVSISMALQSIPDGEDKIMAVGDVDYTIVRECNCVVVGTVTHYTSVEADLSTAVVRLPFNPFWRILR